MAGSGQCHQAAEPQEQVAGTSSLSMASITMNPRTTSRRSHPGNGISLLELRRKEFVVNYSYTILAVSLCLMLTFAIMIPEAQSESNPSVRRVLSAGVQTSDPEQQQQSVAAAGGVPLTHELNGQVGVKSEDDSPQLESALGADISSSVPVNADDTKRQVHDDKQDKTHTSKAPPPPSTSRATTEKSKPDTSPASASSSGAPKWTTRAHHADSTETSAPGGGKATNSGASINRQVRATTKRRPASSTTSSTTTAATNTAATTPSSITTTTPFSANSTAPVAQSESEPSKQSGKLAKSYSDDDPDEVEAAAELEEAERAAARWRRLKKARKQNSPTGTSLSPNESSSSSPVSSTMSTTDAVSPGSLSSSGRQGKRPPLAGVSSTESASTATTAAHRGAKHTAGHQHHNGSTSAGHHREPDHERHLARGKLASVDEGDESEDYGDYETASERATSLGPVVPAGKTTSSWSDKQPADLDQWSNETHANGGKSHQDHLGNKLTTNKSAPHDAEHEESATTSPSPLDARSPGAIAGVSLGKRLADRLAAEQQKGKLARQPTSSTTTTTPSSSTRSTLSNIKPSTSLPGSGIAKTAPVSTAATNSTSTTLGMSTTEPGLNTTLGTTPSPVLMPQQQQQQQQQQLQQYQQQKPSIENKTEGAVGGLMNDTVNSDMLDWSKLVKVMFKSAKDNQTVYTVVMNSSELSGHPISDWSSELPGLLRRDFEKLIQKWLNIFRVDHLKSDLANLVPDKHLVNVSLVSPQQASSLSPQAAPTNQSSTPERPAPLAASINASLSDSLNKTELAPGAVQNLTSGSIADSRTRSLDAGGTVLSLAGANNTIVNSGSPLVNNQTTTGRTNGSATTTTSSAPTSTATGGSAIHLLGQIHRNTEQVSSLRHFMIVCSVSVVIATSLIVALIVALFK